MNPQVRIGGVREAIRRGHGLTRVLHQVGMLGMQERCLTFAEHRESNFVYRRRTNRVRMADIDLLNSFVRQVTESRQVGTSGLESRKRLLQMVLFEIIVARQMLLFRKLVIHFYSELIAVLVPKRNSLKSAVSDIRLRHKLVHQIRCRGVKALHWDLVVYAGYCIGENSWQDGATWIVGVLKM